MTKKFTKRIISFMVTLAMVMAVMPIIPAMADGEAEEFQAVAESAAVTAEVESKTIAQAEPEIMLMSAPPTINTVEDLAKAFDSAYTSDGESNKVKVEGNTVTLLQDSTVTNDIIWGGTGVTLDVGTYTLTLGGEPTLNNEIVVWAGDLTITGSGKITTNGMYPTIDMHGPSSLTVNGTLTIENQYVTTRNDEGKVTGVAISAAQDQNTSKKTIEITGATVKGVNALSVFDGSDLTINSGTFTGYETGQDYCPIRVSAESTATIKDGTIKGKPTGISTGNGSTVNVEGGNISAEGTNIEGTDYSGNGILVASSDDYAGGKTTTVNISGTTASISGKYAVAAYGNNSDVQISGGTIRGEESGVCVYNGASTEIKEGASVDGRYGAIAFGGGKLTVSGGTVHGAAAGVSTNGSDTSEDTTITISGGTVDGGIAGAYMPAGKLNVSGEGDTAPTIKGQAGIVVRGGDVDVQGGTIEATGTGNVTIGDATKGGHTYTVPAAGITVDTTDYPAQKDGQKRVTIGGEATVKATQEGGKTLAACKGEDEITAEPGSQVEATENPFSVSGGTFTTGDGTNKSQDAVNQFLAKNYEYNENGIEYKGTDPEVTLDGVKYGTLEDAIAAASNGSTITLIENVEIESLINITKAGALTINLNDKNITRKPGTGNGATVFYIKGNGDLTIEGEGTVTNDATAVTPGNLILVEGPNAKLTINGGTFTQNTDQVAVHASQGADVTVSGGTITGSTTGEYSAVYVGGEGSTFTMTGGKIEGTEIGLDVREKAAAEISGMADVSGRYGAIAFGGGQMTVSGGTVHGTAAGIGTNGSDESADTTITVSGGTVSGDVAGVYLPSGKMTVKENADISGQAGIVQFGGELTVEGGTITANGTADVKIGDSDQAVPPAAVATNTSSTGSYGTPKATLKNGKFEAADGKDAVTYTENGGDAEGDSALTVEGGNYSAPVDSNLLSTELNYEAKSTDPDTPYSYHQQKEAAETAAGAGGTVEEIIKDADSTAVILNGDSKITEITKTTDEDNNEVVNITVSVGEIGATEAGSAAGDAQKGDAAFWVGVGLVKPADATGVEYTRPGLTGYPETFTPNNGNGSFDTFAGGQGFAAWVNVGEAAGGRNALATYVMKWTKADGETVVTYNITFKDVTLDPEDVTPYIDEVGFNADATAAGEAIEDALEREFTAKGDVVDNTMYAVFHLQGTPDNTNVTATFTNGTATYTDNETFIVTDNDKHVIYFGFNDADRHNAYAQGQEFGEGHYTVTVTAGSFHTTASLDVYKVEFKDSDTDSDPQSIYIAAKSAEEANTAAAAMVNDKKPENYGGKVFTGWGTAQTTGYTITYTAQFKDYEPVVAKANIADKDNGADGIVDSNYNVTKGAKTADGKYTITGTATNLKKHKNGDNNDGYWFGVEIKAPDDVDTSADKQYKVTFGEDSTEHPSSFDELQNITGAKGAILYFDTKGTADDTLTVTIEWDANHKYTYVIDLSNVKHYVGDATFVEDGVGFLRDKNNELLNGLADKIETGKRFSITDCADNTFYAVFKVDPANDPVADYKVKFTKDGATPEQSYTETVNGVGKGGIAFFSPSYLTGEKNNFPATDFQGKYNVTVTKDGASEASSSTGTIEVYKVVYNVTGGTFTGGTEITKDGGYVASEDDAEKLKKPEVTPADGNTAAVWTKTTTDYTITYTATCAEYVPVVEAATIADSNGDVENVVGDYSAEYTEKDAATGHYKITGTAADLKKHTNGDGTEGYWFGVEIKAPDDVDTSADKEYKVTFDEDTTAHPSKFDDLVNIADAKGTILYFDTKGDGNDKHTVTIEWDDSTKFIYDIDLSEVKHYVENPTVAEGNTTEGTKSEDYTATVGEYTTATGGYKKAEVKFTTTSTQTVPWGVNGANKEGNWVGITVAPPADSKIIGLATAAEETPIPAFTAPNPQDGDSEQLSGYYVDANNITTKPYFFVKIKDSVSGVETIYCYLLTKDASINLEPKPAADPTVEEGNEKGTMTPSTNYTATVGEYTTDSAKGYRKATVTFTSVTGKTVPWGANGAGTPVEGNWVGITVAPPAGSTITGLATSANDTKPAAFTAPNAAEGDSALLSGYYVDASKDSIEKPFFFVEITDANGAKTVYCYNLVMDASIKSALEAKPVTKYTVTCETATGGKVEADKTDAAEDETVTLTVTAETGYKLDTLVVKDAANTEVTTAQQADGTYTFTMPASNVTVTAAFAAETVEPDTAKIEFVGFVTKDENGNGILNALAPQVKGDGATWGTDGIRDCIANTLYAAFSADNEEGVNYTVKFTKGEKSYEQTVEGVTKGGLAYVSFDDEAKDAFGAEPQGEYTVELFKNGTLVNASSDKIKVYQVKYVAGEGVTGNDTVVYTDAEGLDAAKTARPEGFALASGMNRWNDNKAETSGYTVTVTLSGYRRSTSSGGGSSSKHSVSTPSTSSSSNGSVSVSSKSASKGSKVTITVKPDEGYKTGSVTVKDANGNILEVTDNGDGTYSFVMPDTKVSVAAEFVEEGTATPAPDTTPSPEPTPAPDAEDNCPSEKFVDVDQSQWYHEGIDYALTNGLMSGMDDTTFEPDSTTTRAMIVAVLYRLDGSPEVAMANFTDVPENAWYANAVAWGEANGVVSGYDEETFGPEDSITREQMASILYRYAQYKGIDVSAQADLSGYSDADTVSEWAYTSLSWANAEGLVSGMSDTELAPTGTATRAQIASILMRFCENIAE